MHPEEARAQRRRQWTVAVCVMVALTVVVPIVAVVLLWADDGALPHALGRTEPRSAEVVDVAKVGHCTRNRRDTYTFAWTEDGERRTGEAGKCGDPWEVGDRVEIWTADGAVQTDPPSHLRLAGAALGLILVLGLGVAIAGRARHR